MAEKVLPTFPRESVTAAVELYAWFEENNIPLPALQYWTTIAILCLVYAWRDAHPKTRALWKGLEYNAKEAVRNEGVMLTYGRFKFFRQGAWLQIRLPSGRSLCYPHPQIDSEGSLSYAGRDTFTHQWKRIHTYGGKLCLAAGTPVLTRGGWVPIETVSPGADVWDGENWVCTSGAVSKGEKPVYPVFGVSMTADHEVLTAEGWKSASSCAGYHRAPCRLPDSRELRGIRREEISLEHPLRLWGSGNPRGDGVEETVGPGDNLFLRLPAKTNDRRQEHNARHDEAPGLLGVAQHARPVPASNAPVLGELRGPGNPGMPRVGRFPNILGKHGADVPQGRGPGTEGQQQGLFRRELQMGNTSAQREQPEDQQVSRDSSRPHVCGPSSETLRAELHDTSVQAGPWLPARAVVRPTYDLMDCGPGNRFVVRGSDGLPLIVHNCENATQSFARDVFTDAGPRMEAAGYDLILPVHDENVTETPDTPEYSSETLAKIMTMPPSWKPDGQDSYAPDLPLAAAGFEGYRY
jgi:hypothetical protein